MVAEVATVVAAQVAAMAAVVIMPVAAIAVVMTVAMRAAVVALVAGLATAQAAVTVVASVRLIARPVRMHQHQHQHTPLMLHHAHLIVRRWIVRVMAKIALRQISIVMRLRVAILPVVASVVLRRVKTAHQPVMVLIVRPLLSAVIAVIAVIAAPTVRSVAVTVIRVQRGAAVIALRRVVNTLMQHLRNVANSHRALSVLSVPTVLSAPTVPATTICRFSAQRG